MATGGVGDVLTGIIAALIGQNMDTLEASILGVYLHIVEVVRALAAGVGPEVGPTIDVVV